MSEAQLWLALLSGLTSGTAYVLGRREGRKQKPLNQQEKSDIWLMGHQEGFWNGRLSHGDSRSLTGIEHAKATNPYRSQK
jgi:hypothetical protein